MRVFVLTDSPSPYQVELFNEIEAQGGCELKVGYLRSRDPLRQWTPPEIRHESIDLDAGGVRQAREAVRESDLVVFNYYFHSHATELIGERASRGGPWCFWGERPGFRQPVWAAVGGRLFRRWKLARLHGSSVPIWGIGKFAVDEYRREFGPRRPYFNLPYFSNLERFGGSGASGSERVFLFCGSLIARKGVDLVARAFVQVATEFAHIRLKIAGDGELRQALMQTLQPVRERVEFVGFKNWDELPELYASADVLCVPSRYDGWGLVVPEGLASGLPVIATDRMGAALEFVQSDSNGWLIPAGDEMEILRAMRKAASLTNAELAEVSQRARDSVKDHTLKHGSERFVRFARETIGV